MSMNEEKWDHPWIQTFSGKQFFPLNPRAQDVTLVDIAHALSMKCRYSGHSNGFYSVAEHSVLVSRALPVRAALWGLLHDASEAYLPDVCRPIKSGLPGFAEIEANVMRAVREYFGLEGDEPPEVKETDTAILADELAQVMAKPPRSWKLPLPPLGVKIQCLAPYSANALFLQRFYEIERAGRVHA